MSVRMGTIGELMSALGQQSRETEHEPPRPLHEAQIMELREAWARFQVPARERFVLGQLVTPTRGSPIDSAGEPHLVVEMPETPLRPVPALEDATGVFAPSFYPRLDLRVMRWTGTRSGVFCATPFWVESWCFVAYEGELP